MTANLRKKRQIEATVHGYCHAATASGSIDNARDYLLLI